MITDLVINVGFVTIFPLQRMRLLLLPPLNLDHPLLVTRLGAVGAVAPAPILPAVAPATLTTLEQNHIQNGQKKIRT